jgi:hypothetical protein
MESTKGPKLVYKCPTCSSTDIMYRVYGSKPRFIVVACWDCRQFYTVTVPDANLTLEYKKETWKPDGEDDLEEMESWRLMWKNKAERATDEMFR